MLFIKGDTDKVVNRICKAIILKHFEVKYRTGVYLIPIFIGLVVKNFPDAVADVVTLILVRFEHDELDT